LRIAEQELAHVVAVDIAEGVPPRQGASDILQSARLQGFEREWNGTNGTKRRDGEMDVVIIMRGGFA